MNEFTAHTWDDLNRHIFEDAWDEKLRRFRPQFVFRGMPDASHDLSTTLSRLGSSAGQVERPLLRAFKKYAPRNSVPNDSIWNWLAVAQHHGLPTRLLDWSFSPYIAAHFATEDTDQFDRDGVIWAVDFTKTNAMLPLTLKRLLEQELVSMFTAEMLDIAARTLSELDRIDADPFVLFFEPPALDTRFVNQYALFSLMSSPAACLSEWLADKTDAYSRIIVPAALKWEIRDKLDLLNINERLLFPDLDGLSRWLKRYYNPSRQNEDANRGE